MSERTAAPIAWVIAALAAALAVIGLVLSASAAAPSGDNAEVRQFAAIPAGILAYALIGAVVASRRPANRIGWILLATGLTWELFVFGTGYVGYATFVAPGRLPAVEAVALLTADMWLVSGSLIGVLFVLFPEGRSLSARWRAAMWLMLGAIGMQIIVRGLGSQIPNRTYLANPIGSAGADAFYAWATDVQNASWPAFFVLAAAALVVRFRRSRGQERKQLDWIATGAAFQVGAVVVLQLVTVSPLHSIDPGARFAAEVFAGVPFAVSFCVVPIAAGVAILRYRLYDLDLLINRALVYATLSAVLGATYFLAVLALEALLRPLTAGSELAVALSTLAVVGSFAPARTRIQAIVDRRFYRSRYDAVRTLDEFGARLRDEVDLDAVRADLVDVVGRTVQPAHASVWLRR